MMSSTSRFDLSQRTQRLSADLKLVRCPTRSPLPSRLYLPCRSSHSLHSQICADLFSWFPGFPILLLVCSCALNRDRDAQEGCRNHSGILTLVLAVEQFFEFFL